MNHELTGNTRGRYSHTEGHNMNTETETRPTNLERARVYLGHAIAEVPMETPYTEVLEDIVNVLSCLLEEMEQMETLANDTP